jgi:hypothetical protein
MEKRSAPKLQSPWTAIAAAKRGSAADVSKSERLAHARSHPIDFA